MDELNTSPIVELLKCQCCDHPRAYRRELGVEYIPRHKDVLKGCRRGMTTLTIDICQECYRLYSHSLNLGGGWDSWDQVDSVSMIIQDQRKNEVRQSCYQCGIHPDNCHSQVVQPCISCEYGVCVFHAHSRDGLSWMCAQCGGDEPLATSYQLGIEPREMKHYLENHPQLIAPSP